jgi:hypothetical protein
MVNVLALVHGPSAGVDPLGTEAAGRQIKNEIGIRATIQINRVRPSRQNKRLRSM